MTQVEVHSINAARGSRHPRFPRHQATAAGDLGQRRLRRDRHHAADRRRVAGRSRRRARGERVLDVAAGNGNATLAAARRCGEVTSTDYVPALLDEGRERAAPKA